MLVKDLIIEVGHAIKHFLDDPQRKHATCFEESTWSGRARALAESWFHDAARVPKAGLNASVHNMWVEEIQYNLELARGQGTLRNSPMQCLEHACDALGTVMREAQQVKS